MFVSHSIKESADRFLQDIMPWFPGTREDCYLALYLKDSALDSGINSFDPFFKQKKEAYIKLIIRIAKFQSDELHQDPNLGIELRNAFEHFSRTIGAKNKHEALDILNTMTKRLNFSRKLYDSRPSGFFILPSLIEHIKPYVNSPEFDQYTNFQFSESLCRTLAYEYADRPDKSYFFAETGPEAGRAFTVEKFSTDLDVALHAPHAAKRARGMIVMPEEGTELEPGEAVPLWFTWTGTDSGQSALADVTEINPGEYSYRLLESQFMRESLVAIEMAKKRFPGRKIALNFTGHSLGGALSQLHFCSMQRLIAESVAVQSLDFKTQKSFNETDEEYLRTLEEQSSTRGVNTETLRQIVQEQGIDVGIIAQDISVVTLNPWNSTGIIEAAASYTKKLIMSNEQAGIPSKGNYVIFAGDLVQQTGTRNAMDDPRQQDITTLVINNRTGLISNLTSQSLEGILPAAVKPIGNIIKKSIEAVPAHTGRLSSKGVGTGPALKTDQSYRVLRSRVHAKALKAHLGTQSLKYREGDSEVIRMHLHDNKSALLEKAKLLQPMISSRIDKGSVTYFIAVMGRQELDLEKKKIALKHFVEHRIKPPVKKLSSADQKGMLWALLEASPILLEKMDQLFLDAKNKNGVDIDTLFDKEILQAFQSDIKALTRVSPFLFDRVLHKEVGIEKNVPPTQH